MKVLGKLLIALIAFIIAAILALLLLVDANRFKPRIEALAQEQGIALQIKGDLGWKLWPGIGVAVADVSIAAVSAPELPIVQLRQASLLLKLMPLLSGDFQVDHILVDGVKVNLAVDTNNKGNWEALSQPQKPAQPSAPAADEVSLKLAVERISLVDSVIDYADAKSGQKIFLQDINLTLTDVNTLGKPFALDLAWTIPADTSSLALKGRLQNRVTLDEKLTHVQLDEGELQLEVQGKGSTGLVVNYSLSLTDVQNQFAIKLVAQGNSLNLDDYLPPPAATPAGTPATGASEDVPLPLEALRRLNLDAQLKLDSLRYNNLQLDNVALSIKAKKGIIEQTLSAKTYEGDIRFASTTDARRDQAALKFDGSVTGVELAPLLKALEVDEKLGLSGAIQAQAQGTAQGASVNQLLASMHSTAEFSGAQVRLSPLNIEEQFCKLVNLVNQNPAEVSWDAFTELRQLDGNIVWREQMITLNSFNAGVSQLLLASTGVINLLTDQYEFKLPFKLADASAAASLKGCSVATTNYWVGRSLSLLRCKGSLAAIDPLNDCGFDKSALGDLTKDFAEYKLREKHGAKIDAAEQKFEAQKQDVKQQVEDKKQELIDKLQNKLFKTPRSSVAASAASESVAPAVETAVSAPAQSAAESSAATE